MEGRHRIGMIANQKNMKHSKFFALFLTTLSLFALPDGMAHAQSNVGREFYLAFPANWEFPAGEKYIRLYIASEVETRVDIYALGQFRRSVKTKPNDIVTSDLSNLEGQIFVRDDKSHQNVSVVLQVFFQNMQAHLS